MHQHGGPEVLVYEDAPEPQIKANEILLRVRACALNHLDLFVRGGIPGMKFDMPHILGSDIAGEVVRVGELCERVKPGWRVLLSPGLSCRQCAQCVSGQDNLCRHYTIYAIPEHGVVAATPNIWRRPNIAPSRFRTTSVSNKPLPCRWCS